MTDVARETASQRSDADATHDDAVPLVVAARVIAIGERDADRIWHLVGLASVEPRTTL
jgi:hypothetical protein